MRQGNLRGQGRGEIRAGDGDYGTEDSDGAGGGGRLVISATSHEPPRRSDLREHIEPEESNDI